MARVRRRAVDAGGDGEGARTWAVSAGDPSELGDWLARVLSAGADAGVGQFDARLQGTAEACRYALEVAGVDVGLTVGGPETDVRLRDLSAASATALLDAWTEGLDLVVASTARPDELWLRRSGATRGTVRVAAAGRALTAALDAAPIDDREDVEPGAAARVPSRRRPLTFAAVAVVGAVLVGVVAVTVSERRAGRLPALLHVQPEIAADVSAFESPPVPSGSAIATDPATGGFLVVGCCEAPRDGMQRPAATWRWDGSTWEHLHPAGALPYSSGMVLGYDPWHNTFVLYGGETAPQSWTWDRGPQGWVPDTGGAPQPSPGQAAVAGQVAGGLPRDNSITLLTPGGHAHPETWSRTYDGWRLVNSFGPAAFAPFAIADDPAQGDLVMVSQAQEFGRGATQTSVYDARGWTAVGTSALPFDPATQLAWDGSSQRVLAVLPGDSAVVASGARGTAQTWAWDGRVWTEIESLGGPGGRGRLLTSWLGVVLFMSDATTGGNPDVQTWSGATWSMHPGGAGVRLRYAPLDTTTLLGAHGLVLTGGPLRGDVDQGAAAEVAAHALPEPQGQIRTVSISLGTILRDTTRAGVCTCWVWVVLRTSLPACPGLELVEAEALILIDAGSNRLLSVFQDRAPPATAFSCGV